MFGRSVLSSREVQGMNICSNIIDLYKARERSEDWLKWELQNEKAAGLLEWAAKEYKTWQTEYR